MNRWALAAALSIFVCACSDEFDPIAHGKRPFAVFALLNATVDTQVVRVVQTTLPGTSDPGYPSVPGTSVTLAGPSGTFSYRDSVIVPSSGSDTATAIHIQILQPFLPVRGETYQLTVQTDEGTATATTTVPEAGILFSSDYFILQNPSAYSPSEAIIVRAWLSPHTLGYLVRCIVEYEELIGTTWVKQGMEVPLMYTDSSPDPLKTAGNYPTPTRRTSSVSVSPDDYNHQEHVQFTNLQYMRTLKIVYGRTVGSFRLTRALFVLSQADPNFFTYYGFANAFEDPVSVRADRPDYSNMNGAIGFFGALTADTLAFPLPPYIIIPGGT